MPFTLCPYRFLFIENRDNRGVMVRYLEEYQLDTVYGCHKTQTLPLSTCGAKGYMGEKNEYFEIYKIF